MSVKYPKGEVVWVSYYNKSHELLFIITSKPIRDYYYLYEFTDVGFKKLDRTTNPAELEEGFSLIEKCLRKSC